MGIVRLLPGTVASNYSKTIGNYLIESLGQKLAGFAKLTDLRKCQIGWAEAPSREILMGDGVAPGIEFFK